ncbi:hypothetical protein [Paraburkholderia strydomiana]|uniref:hypothetical protein n=1 Tax=Paraburkholderia strydomiana TaxID=1245417 RepID=UPI001BEB1363|nr:hypothetical protein [Paraburkholderia strydomiana]MBT2795341.1 hypothetical protein [Paraburkholderia strydomiana]
MSIQAVGHSAVPPSASAVPSNSGSTSTTPASSSSATASPAKGSSASTSSSSYTVNISSAARALMAEASETSVQTAQEGGKGDQQAQRLLAREAAAKAA